MLDTVLAALPPSLKSTDSFRLRFVLIKTIFLILPHEFIILQANLRIGQLKACLKPHNLNCPGHESVCLQKDCVF